MLRLLLGPVCVHTQAVSAHPLTVLNTLVFVRWMKMAVEVVMGQVMGLALREFRPVPRPLLRALLTVSDSACELDFYFHGFKGFS